MMLVYKDAAGVLINTGSIIRHGNKKGIVAYDEYEGQYAIMENGLKLRIRDYCNRITVVTRKGGQHVNG